MNVHFFMEGGGRGGGVQIVFSRMEPILPPYLIKKNLKIFIYIYLIFITLDRRGC